MAMNRIQFQPGLSMPEFLKGYGTEAQCEQALEVTRWPEGFTSACSSPLPPQFLGRGARFA